MTSFRWLHLSDLHRGMKGQSTLWANIEHEFFLDLTRLHAETGPWDAIFFTGDLVQRGQKNEFQHFTATLTRLYDHLATLGSKPVLLTIPGNHDLVRPEADDPALLLLSEWSERANIRDAVWQQPKSDYRKLITAAFKNYHTWSEQHPYPRLTDVIKGKLPGDFAATLTKEDLKIGVLGLNSTFLQLTGGDYTGKLAVDMEQVVGLLGEQYVDWFMDHTACILLTHQPPDWLTPAARATLNGEIAPPGRFAAHLYGHMHEANTTNIASGGSQPRLYLQGCSLFGLEWYGSDGQHVTRQHGYSVGQLEVMQNGGQLRLWPRKAERHQSGHWHVVADSSFTLLADQGTPPTAVPVLLKNWTKHNDHNSEHDSEPQPALNQATELMSPPDRHVGQTLGSSQDYRQTGQSAVDQSSKTWQDLVGGSESILKKFSIFDDRQTILTLFQLSETLRPHIDFVPTSGYTRIERVASVLAYLVSQNNGAELMQALLEQLIGRTADQQLQAEIATLLGQLRQAKHS